MAIPIETTVSSVDEIMSKEANLNLMHETLKIIYTDINYILDNTIDIKYLIDEDLKMGVDNHTKEIEDLKTKVDDIAIKVDAMDAKLDKIIDMLLKR